MFHPFGERTLAALVVIFSTLVFFAATAYGQVTGGSVTGSVQDPTSAAIAGATVKLINNATSAVQTTATDNSGNFQFLLAPPGVYVLEVATQGFRTFRRDGIVVEADRSLASRVTSNASTRPVRECCPC